MMAMRPVLASLVGLVLFGPGAGPAGADPGPFWSAWGDGKAELSGYRLTQPRYGQKRAGTAVLIYVTEDFSESARVKADPGKHAPAEVYPVLKLNFIRKFQTGIYDYSVMTSLFSRVDWPAGERPWPARKISFSSQEWCGHVYHQILMDRPQAGKLLSESHSYFDGEADGRRELDRPPGGTSEDELPVLLRSFAGRADLLAPGASLDAPFLPGLLRTRLLHQPLSWGTATLARKSGTDPITTPAGRFAVITYTVAIRLAAGSETGTYQFEAAAPHRLVRWHWDSGEEGQLLGSARLSYWTLNGPGGEAYLEQLGLGKLGKKDEDARSAKTKTRPQGGDR